MVQSARYCSAKEAAQLLGVSVQTIYAYVSRGRLRSVASPDDVRRRLYLRGDVESLVQKQELQREPQMAARRALDWGAPVLESSISNIEDGRLSYRGVNVTSLVASACYEQVLSLLWTSSMDTSWLVIDEALAMWDNVALNGVRAATSEMTPLTQFLAGLPVLDALDARGYDWTADGLRRCGLVILSWMTHCFTGVRWRGDMAHTLSDAWLNDASTDDTRRFIDMALILCAEHELNISTFTGRCAISAGTTPYGAITASAVALGGRKHAGTAARIEAMFAEAGRAESLAETILSRRRRGDSVPGFAHPLYPDGDVRSKILFEGLKASPFADRATPWIDASMACCARFYEQQYPTIDLALVVLVRALGLPMHASLALFGLGRCSGWIAHMIEQTQDNQLIRPRAVYTGPR